MRIIGIGKINGRRLDGGGLPMGLTMGLTMWVGVTV